MFANQYTNSAAMEPRHQSRWPFAATYPRRQFKRGQSKSAGKLPRCSHPTASCDRSRPSPNSRNLASPCEHESNELRRRELLAHASRSREDFHHRDREHTEKKKGRVAAEMIAVAHAHRILATNSYCALKPSPWSCKSHETMLKQFPQLSFLCDLCDSVVKNLPNRLFRPSDQSNPKPVALNVLW